MPIIQVDKVELDKERHEIRVSFRSMPIKILSVTAEKIYLEWDGYRWATEWPYILRREFPHDAEELKLLIHRLNEKIHEIQEETEEQRKAREDAEFPSFSWED